MFDPEIVASDMQRIFPCADGPGAVSPGADKRSHARVLRPLEPIPAAIEPATGQRSRRLLVVLACCASIVLVLFGAFIAYAIEAQKVYAISSHATAPAAGRSLSRPVPAPPPPKSASPEGDATAYRVAAAPPAIPARHVFRRRVAERSRRDPAIAVPLTGEALDRALVEDAAVTRRLNQEAIDGVRPTLGYAPGVTEAAPR